MRKWEGKEKHRQVREGRKWSIGIKGLLFVLACFMLSGCKREQEELLVGAAASLKPVLEELETAFNKENPDIKISFSFAGSGTLEQQIREGAPIDVFLSAAEKQMDSLANDNLILDDTRRNLLENQLVLVVPKDSSLGISGFEDILKASVISLGDPNSVPVGQYAQEVFESIGIMNEVVDKATFGKDVTEVLSWVSSNNAEAGVVYATDALSNSDVEIVAYAPEGSHSRILYPAAVVKASEHVAAAESFLDFLETKEAKELFSEYGFKIME